MNTIGISPKLIAAVLAAIVSYLLTQTVLELAPGVVLALQVIGIAVAVYAAKPGVVTDGEPS